uniref:Uncharacterized protein n=1 Tax=viral metagenome TaxID=1070528 RepID=A0A6C0JHQ4_9ZZZZ
MYENSKTNLDNNVLEKIKTKSWPFILLLLILIIIVFVLIITDYISFSKIKPEGFDIPPNNAPNNIPPSYNPGNIPPGYNQDSIPPGYNPDNIPPGKVEDYLNNYKKSQDEMKNLESLSKQLNYFKNLNIAQQAKNYENTLKNEMLSIVNNEANSIKNGVKNGITNGITNINLSIPTIKNPKISNSIISVSFILIILILCIVFLPSLGDFKSLFNQINNVTYVILYTIFIILFFRLLPRNILDSNAYYIVPITLIIAFILFVISFRSNYVQTFNVNYERIKMIILYFCFITLGITYYSVNPGEYMTKNFNTSLLLTLLMGIFGFIYLIVLLTLPNISNSFKDSTNTENVLGNISAFSKYGGIGFFLFIIIMTIVITTYPGGFFKNTNSSIVVSVLLFVICIIWSILLVVNMFTGFKNNKASDFIDSKLTYAKKALLALFGFTLSGIIIAFIVYNIQHLSGYSSIISFILSIFLIIAILILIYKTIFVKLPSNGANKSKDGFFDLLINLIFYIPCLFSGVFDVIMKTVMSEYYSTTSSNLLILLIIIVLLLLYIFLPKIQHFINIQGGKQLVENPVYTNNLYPLANYEQLNGNDNLNYQYSISFWIFLDANAPNTSPSYSQYSSLLNYGGKPNVLYKADTNTLMITMDQKDLDKKSKNKLLEFDDNGNRIVYINKNLLLQKWNNIIINFNGGTLDIFLNGELVKSSIEVIPYMKLDALTVGSDNGVNGGICNVVYFKKSLTITNIYNIYNNMKNKNPPVTNNSNNTIISIK